jgi:chromosome condensin MukBEF complex kleisin-like MukF subunit
MAELERILGEAEGTHRQMQDAVKTSGARTSLEILRLRTRFATLTAEMLGAVKSDPRLQQKPDLAAEFESRFGEMRRALIQHQGRWHGTEIDQNPTAYRQAGDALGQHQEQFYSWARQALAGL